MPLFIPILIGVGIAASAATGGGLTIGALGNIKKAKSEYNAACDNYKAKRQSYESYYAGTESRLQKLGGTRKNGMEAVIEAIKFIKRAKLINPNIISDPEVKMEDLENLNRIYEDILKNLTGATGSIAGGAGVGVLTALGAYGVVGALGTASTGTAIGGLSGAAASSATLAWLGGGALAAGGLGIAGGTAVLGGLVAAPIPIAVGAFTQWKARKVRQEAAKEIQKLKVKVARLGREQARLKAVRQRADELETTIDNLVRELGSALQNANSEVAEDVYRVAQMAKALRAAIDQPVIPPDTNKASR